jgi:hypothetical protein
MQHRHADRRLARRGLAAAALTACLAAAIACLVAAFSATAWAGAAPAAPLGAAPRDPSYSVAAQRQVALLGAADGAVFDQNHVVTDVNFTAVDSLTSAALQQFLAAQTGILATYRAPDHLGKTRSAAAIILQAARAWQVSPKVLLATLQKEQSLLSAPKPSTTALDWAMGCGVPDSGALQTKYQGFGKQLWYGAETLHVAAQGWVPGTTKVCGDGTVTPTDASTWALYTYTPWIGVKGGGNKLFWTVYLRYYGDPLAVDRTAPTATVSGADTDWHNAAVTLHFSAVDDAGGTGVRSIESSLDGGVTWTAGTSTSVDAPADHSNDGAHPVLYRATDDAGNVAAPQSCTVKIATRRPHPVANWRATATRGGTARLTYVITEHRPGPATADVVIRVRNAAGRLRATLTASAVSMNTRHTLSFQCTLPAGKYRFVINAVDAAGNRQAEGAANTLVVKAA